jgi:putative transposase
MPQSHAAILVHVIFSTKNREPFIQPDVEPELYPYLATACRSVKSNAILINGTADHIHLLVNLGRKTAIGDLIEEIKTSSSR